MESTNTNSHILNPTSKVFITEQYKSFIKPSSYKNESQRLRQVTVEYLTDTFEVKDVDHQQVLAENEFFTVNERNPKIGELYQFVEKLRNFQNFMGVVGNVHQECKLKLKLLKKLESSNNNHGQSSKNYEKKFEKVLKKDNETFINNHFKAMKGLEVNIGLEFLGSLNEAVLSSHQEMISNLANIKQKIDIESPPERLSSCWMLDNEILLVFKESYSQGYAQYTPQFLKIQYNKSQKKIDLQPLDCHYNLSNTNRLYKIKYFSEGNILVIIWSHPEEEENKIVNIFEMEFDDQKVNIEPLHKVSTKSEQMEFIRLGGIQYIVYSGSPFQKQEKHELCMLNLDDIFMNAKSKPRIEKILIDITCYQFFDLGCGFLLIEGQKDELALVDLNQGDVLGFYKDHDKECFWNYHSACYSQNQNLLFVLHNNENGAVITTFSVYSDTKRLKKKKDFVLQDLLKEEGAQTFSSKFFTMQFNSFQNRLDLLDDYQQFLIRFKVNEKSELQKDKNTIKLDQVVKNSDTTPSHFLIRLEGDLFFLHYFLFDNSLAAYEIEERK